MLIRPFSIVAATDRTGGIGLKSGNDRYSIPWKCSQDLKFFKHLTLSGTDLAKKQINVLIMGKHTWSSFQFPSGILPGRISIVISRSDNIFNTLCPDIKKLMDDGILHHAKSFEQALVIASSLKNSHDIIVPNIFVIGGAMVYEEAIKHPLCYRIFMTSIKYPSQKTSKLHFLYEKCNIFFPKFGEDFGDHFEQNKNSKVYEDFYQTIPFTTLIENESMECSSKLAVYYRINHDELQYLKLVDDIINNGVRKSDRTGTGTMMVFGRMTRWSLRNRTIPLLTTKKIFLRGVLEELLWFLKGSTDATELSSKGIKIWDGNGSRNFLDGLGFHDREVGDLGPVYGFQWRHFGASYIDAKSNYDDQGIDQIIQIIHLIKTDPDSRRIILTAWNPLALHKMVLPPCHIMAQFSVTDGELSCLMTQRSADVGLGLPFNIASYAMLTHILAHITGLNPGELVISTGDTHIYLDHIEALKLQIERSPFSFPIIWINPSLSNIDNIQSSDIKILDYQFHDTIPMKMSV